MTQKIIDVVQSASVSIPTSLNVSHLVRSVPDISSSTAGDLQFRVVGSSLLQISLPSSTPVYARRNSHVATFNTADERSVVSSLYLGKTLSRIGAWQTPVAFQKIVSSVPVSTLLSSPKSLAVIDLDGTIDWAVPSRDAIHAFSGEQLILQARSRFSFRKNRPNFSHTFLSGRGIVALGSKGNIFKVSLEPSESFLVLKDSLVAYSVDANKHNAPVPKLHHLPSSVKDQSQAIEPPANTNVPESVINQLWRYVRVAASWFHRLVHSDSGKYLRIHGPSTILLQSSVPSALHALNGLGANLNANPLDAQVQQLSKELIEASELTENRARTAGITGPPEHHLKIVTVEGKNVTFESTKTFSSFSHPPNSKN